MSTENACSHVHVMLATIIRKYVTCRKNVTLQRPDFYMQKITKLYFFFFFRRLHTFIFLFLKISMVSIIFIFSSIHLHRRIDFVGEGPSGQCTTRST
jgi:hypothetical protein